ncbi:MAG TPA: hypothetical protein DCZ75_12045 [Geobacter sp.]|nr:hypothetical protein [Geobacter sp.]
MRKAILLLAAAAVAATSVPAFSQNSQAEKDECLLASRNCMMQVDDIHQRMRRLDKEIRKGTRVYSPEELKRLQQKLTETQEMLKNMEKPGH